MMRPLCLALVFSTLCLIQGRARLTAASDPSVVRPGDRVVDGSFIQAYRNAWRYSHKTASGKLAAHGRWTDEVSLEIVDGEEQIVRRQRFPTVAGFRILVNRARRSDLAPRSFEVRADGGQTLQRVDFGDSQIDIAFFGQAEPVSAPLPEPVFDWYLYGILVAGFPLETGYAAKFPALNQNLQPTMRTVKVVGRESIPGPDGAPKPCWKVVSDDGLAFWVSREAPYVFRVRKQYDDGGSKLWEIEGTGFSSYLELRVYKTRVGRRDAFLSYFEDRYIESQEALGMRIWGQFRDLNAADQFVWMRGYRNMEERQAGLMKFYTGELWRNTGGKVREMLAERANHVHFLEPVTPGDALSETYTRAEPPDQAGVVVAQVFLADGDPDPLIKRVRETVAPSYVDRGGFPLGLFRSSDAPNNFPMLPFIENETVVVWLASFESKAAFEAAQNEAGPAPVPFEIFVLEPGERSRLRHRRD